MVLIPLFGIMYIIIFIAFPDGHTDNEFNVVYLYIEMGYNSFQVTVLYSLTVISLSLSPSISLSLMIQPSLSSTACLVFTQKYFLLL